MASRNIPALSSDFIELLRTSGLTKEELQAEFETEHEVRVARTDFETMWESLTRKVGHDDAADLVFAVVADHASDRLIAALDEVRADGSIGWRSDDRAIMSALFFANGNPRKICDLLVSYLDEQDWFEPEKPNGKRKKKHEKALPKPSPAGARMDDLEAEVSRRRRAEDEILRYVFMNGPDPVQGCAYKAALNTAEREGAFNRLARSGHIKLLDREHAILSEHGQRRLESAGPSHAHPPTVHNTFNIHGSVGNLAQVHGDGARVQQTHRATEARALLEQAREAVRRELPTEHQVEADQIIEVVEEQVEKPTMKAVVLRSIARNPIFTGAAGDLLAKAVEIILGIK